MYSHHHLNVNDMKLILVIALVFTTEAVLFSAQARLLAAEKHESKACKQCAVLGGDHKAGIGEASMTAYKTEMFNRHEPVATTEDARPSAPGHSPGVGHKGMKA